MSKYEVFVPAAMTSEFNVTLKVDADNWMAALKTGLQQLGEHGTQVVNILVDIQEDNSIHVTDSASGRVFRIQELSERPAAAAAPAEPVPAAASAPSAAWEAKTDKLVVERPTVPLQPAPVEVAQTEKYDTGKRRSVPEQPAPEPAPKVEAAPPKKEAPQPKKKMPPAPERRIEPRLEVAQEPFPERRRAQTNEPRFVERVDGPSRPVSGPIGRRKTDVQLEDVLADLFERTQELLEDRRGDALDLLLDLALEKIPADAGSVFLGDLARASLKVASARGPKSDELKQMKLELPMGVGVVGFCAQEGVGLAISDTEKDPRFYREVSEKLGYPTRSIICAPMVAGGRSFGCIEIINKVGSSHFTDHELSVLAYVAHQGAKYLERHG